MTTLNESGKSPIANLDYWKSHLEESSLQIPLCFLGKGEGNKFSSINFKLNPELQKKPNKIAVIYKDDSINYKEITFLTK